MAREKKRRGRMVVEIILLLLVAGAAYAYGGYLREAEIQPYLDRAQTEIDSLGLISEQDSAFRVSYLDQIAEITDSMHILEIRVGGLEGSLQRCLSLPPDTVPGPTVYDTVPGPERIVYDTVPVPGPVVYDTTYLPGEITIREVQTGRGYPHWSDFLQVGVAVAACLIIENTGGESSVTFRDNGEIQ